MIQHKTAQLFSVDGKLALHLTITLPEGTPKAVVQLTHGMMEHRGRYLPFMKFLAEHGYASVVHDHRGHGDSVLDPTDLGYLYDATAREIVKDLYKVTKFCKAQFPGLPLYLVAHSMGTLVARNYLKLHDDAVTKLVLLGPPSMKEGTKMLRAFVDKLAECKGSRYRAFWANPIIYWFFNQKIPAAHRWNQWMCSAEKTLDKFDADPKCGFTFTLNGYSNLLQLCVSCYDPRGWRMTNTSLPILMLGGENDPLIGGGHAFHQQITFLRARGYTDVRGRIYAGKRHELLHEDIKETVYGDILRFLRQGE